MSGLKKNAKHKISPLMGKVLGQARRKSVRGQTVHFVHYEVKLYRRTILVCMSLESRKMFLNKLKLCQNDQRKQKNKRRSKRASLVQNLLSVLTKNTQFGFVLIVLSL